MQSLNLLLKINTNFLFTVYLCSRALASVVTKYCSMLLSCSFGVIGPADGELRYGTSWYYHDLVFHSKYHPTIHTAGYLRFGPMAQCVVHALKGAACRSRVTPASSPASYCKQSSALMPPSLHVRGCASPSRAR